jgi:tetratricopeptide (TPR) repeat protein
MLTLTLVGCGNKFRIAREGMPEALRTQLETQLKNGEQALVAAQAAQDDVAKTAALLEIAFAQDQLGRLDLAIPFYKQILELDPKHFAALNNLGVIYEEVGDYLEAAKYYGKLLEADPSNTEALEDALRVLIAAEHFDDAQTNLESFVRYNSANTDAGMQKLISDQFELIRQARLKTQPQTPAQNEN